MVQDAGKTVTHIVIMDTNALIAPFQRGFNLDAELEKLMGTFRILAIPPVIRELEGLSTGNRHARLALSLVRSKGYDSLSGLTVCLIQAIELSRNMVADDALRLIATSCPGEAVFVTNDRELRDMLKRVGARVVIVRAGNRLEYYRE